MHKLSRKLVNENQVIVVEDLNIKGMIKNHKLAKSISDAGWYKFVTYLKYKLEWQGKQLVKIDRFFASSKLCNHYGTKNIMLTLSDREWKCSKCNTNHDRDINASLNIRDEGMRLLSLEITAWDSGKSLSSNYQRSKSITFAGKHVRPLARKS